MYYHVLVSCTLALTNPKKRLAFAISKGMQTLPSPSSDWKRRWKSCTLLTTRSLVLGHSSVEQQDVCAQQAEAFSWLLACGFVRDKVVSTKSDHVNGRIGPSKWWCTIFYTIKIDKTMRRTQFYTIRAALIVPTKSDLLPVLQTENVPTSMRKTAPSTWWLAPFGSKLPRVKC